MLTPKQDKFCKCVALKSMNYTDAYKEAYNTENMQPDTINNNAYMLMQNSEIAARIKELRDKVESEDIMSAIDRKKFLTKMILNSDKEDSQLKAVDLLNKMSGEYITKVEANVDSNIQINVEIEE